MLKEFSLSSKLKYLSELRQEIKKKRFLLDEGKDKFGMSELSQLVKVKNTSEVKGYPFKCSKDGKKIALKIVPIETKYNKNEHPCNIENIVLKELTDNIVLKMISPHITFYLGTQKVSNKARAIKFLNLKKLEVEEKIRGYSNMLIAEYVEGGSLDNWIFNTYENDKEISDKQWKCIVFQLLYTIAVLQHHYKLMHNDFHYGNILIDDNIKSGGVFKYTIKGQTFYLPNSGVIPKLWDCEFAMAYSDKIKDCYPNKFIIGPYTYDKKKHITIVNENEEEDEEEYNVPYNYNTVYDVHYFLTSLLDLYISQELFDWILKLYPSEVIPNDSDSDSDSESTSSHSHSDSDTKSTSYSDSSIETTENSMTSDYTHRHTSSEESEFPKYMSEGRLINGVETQFKLPSAMDLLQSDFFKEFTIIPNKEDDIISFDAGF